MRTTGQATLALVEADTTLRTRWFSSIGSVVEEGPRRSVYVGGTLLAVIEADDDAARNVILFALAQDPRAHLGHIADAFDISPETLRLLCRLGEREGIGALVQRQWGGAHNVKVNDARRAKLHALFDKGLSIDAVTERVGARWKISRTTVARVKAAWAAQREVKRTETTWSDDAVATPVADASSDATAAGDGSAPAREGEAASETSEGSDGSASEGNELATSVEVSSPATPQDEARGGDLASARHVQHVGAWALLAVVAAMKLHERAQAHRGTSVPSDTLRVSLDAVIIALGIGEGCVEGVRRLATPTAATLLRTPHAPAATWVRRVLGRFAGRDAASALLHLEMAGAWMREAREDEQTPVVFYIDNHLRRYTGERVIRRGWRMQDKRVVPGSSDFYVHDEDGRPVLRLHAPENPSLTAVLSRAAALLRAALGPEQRILLAFDRGGSFPEPMAQLRDDGFEFVTYERRPYASLTASAFEQSVTLDDGVYRLHDTRKNLRGGRGRVRRVAVRTPEGHQINLLAVSSSPAPRLLEVMHGRWSQENAFKHGAERWGINQLDGRLTEPYGAEEVIPNPARRRLERALRIARLREGNARRELARLDAKDPHREAAEAELAAALEAEAELLSQRATTPPKIEVGESELADVLVKHRSEYKLLLDTIRAACMNAETDLAAIVGTHLRRPEEARRVLRNIFQAPGDVRVEARTLRVELAPAGTSTELIAIGALFGELNRRNLALPGDPARRRLRFESQIP